MKNKTPVVRGQTVELLILDESWAKATVTQALSTQFLCRIGRGTERFFFYADKGVTWRPIEKTSD
jgi:hypothetical protein